MENAQQECLKLIDRIHDLKSDFLKSDFGKNNMEKNIYSI